MPKKKDKSGEEFWRAKCRELEKRVRQLEKQLGAFQKRQHLLDDAHEALLEVEELIKVVEEPKVKIRKIPCEKCDHGEMIDKLEFDDKVIQECIECGARKSRKK